jgi:tripartite-type tricarboxylate transporter receptor subunit TctC
MTKTMTYPHRKLIPHWFLVRLIIVSPLALIFYPAKFIADQIERFSDVLHKLLPDAYVTQRLEFHQLPQKRQNEIKALNQRIMSQTQKVSSK